VVEIYIYIYIPMERGFMSSVSLTFMVIISVNGNGNVKTCCQEVIIQLRQTTESRQRSEGNGEEGRDSPNHMRCFVSCCCYYYVCVVVVIAVVEGLHRINVVLQHAEA